MRTFLATLFVLALPVSMAAEDNIAVPTADSNAAELEFPAQITPLALSEMADKLEELSRQRLVAGTGGRKTANVRRESSSMTEALAIRLRAAADSLSAARAGKLESEAALMQAQSEALSATKAASRDVGDLELSRQLANLIALPEELPPEPVTHVFCMEASGAGPRTFARYARESLTEALPYVQGYITHDMALVAPLKLRLTLVVEHDADAAAFATLDALHAANKAAVDEMDDSSRTPAETILMGDLAERLCASTPANP